MPSPAARNPQSQAPLTTAVAARAAARQGRVREAERLKATGASAAEIATAFGMTRDTITSYLREAGRNPAPGEAGAPDVRLVNGRLTTPHERRVITRQTLRDRSAGADVLAGLMRSA